MIHQCHAYGCTKPTSPRKLMCLTHWLEVPRDLRRAVYEHFNPLQVVPGNGVRPSWLWLRAARAAINSVGKR